MTLDLIPNLFAHRFMFQFYFILILVIRHVWQTKFASSLLSF